MSKKFPTLSESKLYMCYVCGKKLTVAEVHWVKRKPYCRKCKREAG